MTDIIGTIIHEIQFEVDVDLSLEDLHEMLCILVHEGDFVHHDDVRADRVNRWRELVKEVVSEDLDDAASLDLNERDPEDE